MHDRYSVSLIDYVVYNLNSRRVCSGFKMHQILTECWILRGRAVYAYVFKKNVDDQGTQAIIKNLNLKKWNRFWNQNFIEVNDL